MKFSEELGIKIDSEVMELLKKAIEHAGNRRKLAAAINIGYTTLGNWLGVNEQKGEFITWEQWPAIRNYLVKAMLVDGENPRWMTPSEMRESLSSQLSPSERRLLKAYRLMDDLQRQMWDAQVAVILAAEKEIGSLDKAN